MQLEKMITEGSNAASAEIDRVSTLEMCRIINDEDKTVPLAVERVLPDIAAAIGRRLKIARAIDGLLFVQYVLFFIAGALLGQACVRAARDANLSSLNVRRRGIIAESVEKGFQSGK